MLNLFFRHFLDDFFHTYCRIRVAPDGGQDIPHVCSNQIRGGHAKTDLIIPAHSGLRTGMALHRTAKIPFEGSDMILLDTKPKGIHHTNQFFGIGIARTRQWQKGLARLGKTVLLHKVAGLIQSGRSGDGRTKRQNKACGGYGFGHRAHAALLTVVLASPALADKIEPSDFLQFDPAQAELGQLLFYDKILSGNRNISCGTCHHHTLGSTDRLSLGIGEGGEGLGPERTAGAGDTRVKKRIPRNAPALWNLGHRDIRVLFHDGRVEKTDYKAWVFDTPAGDWVPTGLNSILAAQALFPMTSEAEMAGSPGENEIAGAFKERIDQGWPIIAKTVRTIPEYGDMFVAAFPHIDQPEDVTIVEIVNVIAAFIGTEFQSFDSPYDDWLRDGTPLPAPAERGRQLFFGEAGCSSCHNGPLFSDQDFHAAGLPQFGPGRTRPFDKLPRDVGRMAATDLLDDAYKFRTPSLRNVALTAPYGHNGAYPTLGGMIRHMANPVGERMRWRPNMARLPKADWLKAGDFLIQQDRLEMARQSEHLDLPTVRLSAEQVSDIEAFLHSLTGQAAAAGTLPLGVPERVPSGLPVD